VRIYLLAGAACLLVPAAFGVVHLISLPDRPNNKPVISKPVATEALAKAPTPQASPSPRVDEPVQEPSLTITEVSPKATRLRDGSTNVTVLIGVAPRTTTKKGEVEIQVSFFDITRDYQLRPTDAQVGSVDHTGS
jgi:hypothetical protein